MTTSTAAQQVRRSGTERALILLEILLAVGAFGGAAGFLAGWSAFDELADQLPFGGSMLVAGVALGVVNGLLPAAVVYGALRRRRWARPGHVVVGVVLVTWIVVQVVVLGPPVHPIQVTYLAYGVVVAWLGEQHLRGTG